MVEMIETPLGEVRISVKSNCIHTISIGDMPKEIGNGMSIEQTQAVLISIEPRSDFIIAEITCKLDCFEYKGTASSGQYLDCIEWFGENWHQTMGTEDADALKLRYPEIELEEVPYPIEYSDDGITIKLNVRKVSQTMTLHVLVSSKACLMSVIALLGILRIALISWSRMLSEVKSNCIEIIGIT